LALAVEREVATAPDALRTPGQRFTQRRTQPR
jgi:hypothetical protein